MDERNQITNRKYLRHNVSNQHRSKVLMSNQHIFCQFLSHRLVSRLGKSMKMGKAHLYKKSRASSIQGCNTLLVQNPSADYI